jgi:S1-C subfamily serine protease
MSAGNRPRSQCRTGFARTFAVRRLLVLFLAAGASAAGAPQSVSRSPAGFPARATAPRGPADVSGGRRTPVPWDDRTYRPTVVVRRGTSQGSGTIIASVDGETLVLTASHVVKAEGPIFVELHRYNLRMEGRAAMQGAWPRVISAALAAVDTTADLAIVRIEKMTALPYVARFTHDNAEPPPNSVVTSIGIDLGLKLTHWTSRLVETVTFELNDSGSARPFLITEKIPEHGRSGGGLFLANGDLVGVCIGHSELVKGRRMGVFAAGESIRRLLDDHQLTASLLRSELRMARLKKEHSPAAGGSAPASSSSVVTPTRTVRPDPPVPSAP